MAAFYFRNIQDFNSSSAGFRAFPYFIRYRMAKPVLFWIACYYQVFHNALRLELYHTLGYCGQEM
jgi:hypothetical protein